MLIISGLQELLGFQFAILAVVALLPGVVGESRHRRLRIGLEFRLPLRVRLLLFEVDDSLLDRSLICVVGDALQLIEVLLSVCGIECLFGCIVMAVLLCCLQVQSASLPIVLKPLVDRQQFHNDCVTVQGSVHLADTFDLDVDVKLWY